GAIRRVGVNGSARSYRISIPKGGETIVGFCDKTGNVFPSPEAFAVTATPYVVTGELYGMVADADGPATAEGLASKGGGQPATKNAEALQAAIRALDSVRGGIVRLGFGQYCIDRTVIVDRPVTIEGHGHAEVQAYLPGTVLCVDKRVTCFRFVQSGVLLDNLAIKQMDKDTVTVTGTFTAATRQVALSSTDDSYKNFYDGQLIEIPAAGDPVTLARLKTKTASGFPYAFVYGGDLDSSRGLKVGWYYRIAGAFTDATKLTEIHTVTTRVNQTAYALYDVFRPGHIYLVESIGSAPHQSGGSPPVFPTNGGTVPDGDLTIRDLGTYGSVPTRVNNAVYALYDVFKPVLHIYLVEGIGSAPHQSGGSPPVFPTNGGTVPDGDLTIRDLGAYDSNEGTLGVFAANASGSVSDVALVYCTGRDTRIVCGGGTTTLTVDSSFGPTYLADGSTPFVIS